ncbi:hypothetical protein C8Q70DRAFT_468404 [Cubamyces menziesii]|nr:hypothetical protein C8Q70DRAFT_468404 [Cubamyces menziesii]
MQQNIARRETLPSASPGPPRTKACLVIALPWIVSAQLTRPAEPVAQIAWVAAGPPSALSSSCVPPATSLSTPLRSFSARPLWPAIAAYSTLCPISR